MPEANGRVWHILPDFKSMPCHLADIDGPMQRLRTLQAIIILTRFVDLGEVTLSERD
jgi:hypothetical protein